MAASIGATLFDNLQGPPPRLPAVGVAIYTRPGAVNVGGRILPAAGISSQITLVRFVPMSNMVSTQYGYRSLVGTIAEFSHAGVDYTMTYGYNFLIQDVEVLESNSLARACGIGPTGSSFNYSPAAKIVSRWTMISVPS